MKTMKFHYKPGEEKKDEVSSRKARLLHKLQQEVPLLELHQFRNMTQLEVIDYLGVLQKEIRLVAEGFALCQTNSGVALYEHTNRSGLDQEDVWLTTSELCRYLKISDRTIRNYVKNGYLPAHKLPSGLVRFRLSDVKAFLERRISKKDGAA